MRLMEFSVLPALLLLIALSIVSSQDAVICPDMEYLNVTENLCRPLPDNFDLIFNATRYDVTIYVLNGETSIPADTFLFGAKLYINNSTFTTDIPFVTNRLIFSLADSSYSFGSSGIVDQLTIADVDAFNTHELTIEAAEQLDIGFHESSFTVQDLVNGAIFPPMVVEFSINVTMIAPCSCDGSECLNGGTCVAEGDQCTCECPEGYFGDACENVTDPCEPDPCIHGNCSALSFTNYTCQCDNGYTGTNCDIDILDCIDVDCGNGTCIDLVDDYQCKCVAGYTGNPCIINIDDCDPDPCVNGTCYDLVDDYRCECYLDWDGKDCDSEIDPCENVLSPDFPCSLIGYADCIDGNDTFTCICRGGFTTDNCGIDIDECEAEPCQNNGNCTNLIGTYSCECAFGYTGENCEIVIDFCEDIESCGNGVCNSIEAEGYECVCDPGYTEANCSVDINECDSNPCQNNATCNNEIASYTCNCTADYTDDNCSTPINNCDPNPCLHESTCIDLFGEFMCACLPDYTGNMCETELLFCENTTCLNGGTCVEVDGGDQTTCDCVEGFSGDNCEFDDDVCEVLPQKCFNDATCNEGVGIEYSCMCLDGFDGDDCSMDLDYCSDTTCQNNGTCIEGLGVVTTCDCNEGFSGDNCENDDDVCQVLPQKCLNGATCNEGVGSNYTCSCADGFDGFSCSEDLDFCDATSCTNGGTCVEGFGIKTSCDCPIDFGGDQCEIELIFCMVNYCLNGGSCIDLDGGSGTLCMCPPGFSGDMCEDDDDVCSDLPQKCFNGGSCIEGKGANYTCECADGFGEDDCSDDLDFCEPTYCQNGGTCIEGIGPERECNCPVNYEGDTCETAFCPIDWCFNGGVCSVVDNQTICDCGGCEGDRCETEVDGCSPNPCQNGGTCTDGLCSNYTCACPAGYTGDDCGVDLDHCTPDYCQNNGTCFEGDGLIVSCECQDCFKGDNCEIDETYCDLLPEYCMNGGTCVDGYGCDFNCSCTDTYQGEQCETAYCPEGWCFNGGNCDIENNEAFCECESGCSGDRCEIDSDVCTNNLCKNGGTCIEEACFNYTCSCPSMFTGDNCEIPICQEDSCINGGTCSVVDNNIVCDCPAGYTGDDCGMDLDHCTPDYCQNNGTCVEGDGLNISCDCQECFKGDNCEIDETYCDSLPEYCMNGGTCVDGYGCDYNCSCTDTYQGEQCETAYCPEGWCFNGGNCVIENNEAFCECESGCSGDRCEIDSDVCTNNLCQNGGTCIEEACFNYTCSCPSMFTGDNCEIPICQEDSCINGGTCSVVDNNIVCDCPAGYTGDDCGMDLDHCTPDYCQNNGTCVEGDGLNISCDCQECFKGDNCEIDETYCDSLPEYCMNGGTCVDGYGCDYNCSCTDTYQGEQCEIAYCPEGWCFNGGECVIENNKTVCQCEFGCNGDRCENDEDVCTAELCQNGGTCIESICSNYTCDCPSTHTGDNCETPVCQSDTCQNGGTCKIDNNVLMCECPAGYTGDNCEVIIDPSCKSDSDCSSDNFCEIDCASDDYPPHTALLFEAVTLQGVSFVSIEEARHPDLSKEFSMFAVYNQEANNRGYLIYYGTSALSRNFAIFLDSENTKLYLYYTNTTGYLQSFTIETPDLNGSYDHFLAVIYSGGVVNVYLNGSVIGAGTLKNPDFTYGVSNNPSSIKLFVGARYPRHYRFVGTVKQVVFFSSVLTQAYVQQLEDEFDSIFDPSGNCVPYKSLDSVCPQPTEAPSTLCTSSTDRCNPSLTCLPVIGGDYTCQLQPPTCSSDSDCSANYFCGSELPYAGSNYYENSDMEIPSETLFLQDNSMDFNGEEVVALPTSEAPQLESDISIFAVVMQEPNNDGYIVGKGINGDLRDFGLYFRSSRKTVWLVYGADSHGTGFKEIVFFYNVSIADGNFHSVSAIVDSTANRTLLLIDGEIVGQQSPLPSVPTFRPGHNLLYVGGRPSTRLFRFKGTIRNLFISAAPLQTDTIMRLHNDAMDGDEQISLNLPTSRYCLPYKTDSESCVMGGDTSDFRCLSPAVCVPEFLSDEVRNLPSTNSSFQQLGVCVEPCLCDSSEVDEECGVDGNTYKNFCFRDCVKVTKLHDDACSKYSDLYDEFNNNH